MLAVRLAAAVALSVLAAGSRAYSEPAVSVIAVGDVQLGRGVGRSIAKHGAGHPFAHVARLTSRADLGIANLECALSAAGILIQKRFSFKADPAAVEGMARAGFNIAILANNHSLDCGRSALPETLAALRSHGITPVGAGVSADAAAAPVIVERHHLRIAILARTFVLPEGIIYREDLPTVAVYDPDTMVQEVRAARQQADIVIVSLHWGIEYARAPQESQVRIARSIIDAGADIVIGHHTHTPQPVERYHRGLIAYSLGSFVFDPAGEGGRNGLLLKCAFTRRGLVGYSTTPVRIHSVQPRPVVRHRSNRGSQRHEATRVRGHR